MDTPPPKSGRISPSYHAGVLTWTEQKVSPPPSTPKSTTHRPAGPPRYRVSRRARLDAAAESLETIDTALPPSKAKKRPFSKMAATDPARFEAIVMLVIAILVAGLFAGVKYVTRPIKVNAVPVSPTPNAVAVDSGTNTVYVTHNLPDTVSVIDGWSQEVTATVRVGHHPDGVAVDSTTHTVYVANSDSHTVSVINGSTHAVIATVPVGNTPFGMTVNPYTHNVYVANYGHPSTVSVIDGTTHAVNAILPVGNGPFGVAVDLATNAVYASNSGDHTVSVIDGATDTLTATVPLPNSAVGVSNIRRPKKAQ